MNKYILYRIGLNSEDNDDREDQEAEELVGVEFGNTLDDVLEDLLAGVREDLSGMGEYAMCEINAQGPLFDNFNNPPFNFMGVVIPPVAEENIVVDYIVEVEDQ